MEKMLPSGRMAMPSENDGVGSFISIGCWVVYDGWSVCE